MTSMTWLRTGAASIFVAASSWAALADTGVIFNCKVPVEGAVTVYLNSDTTVGGVEWSGRTSEDAPARDGAFKVTLAGRLFSFVPDWASSTGRLTVKRQGQTRKGACRMP